MNKFFLIGIPNCGKTTLGQRAAESLRLPFFDTDWMACEKLGLQNVLDQMRATINGTMMTAQQKAVDEMATLESAAIIATGAEIALIPRCATRMRQAGTVIHIRRKPEVVVADMKNDTANKMVMRDVNTGEEVVMREEAVRLYALELSQYDALADTVLENNGSEDMGVEKLIALIAGAITCSQIDG